MPRELVMLRVVDTGEIVQITDGAPAKTHMKGDEVLIIIDDEERLIWIWKGTEAPVRRKFIAARRASGIRDQRGLVYKIMSEDEGQEDSKFLEAMGQPLSTKPDTGAVKATAAPPAMPPQPTGFVSEPSQPAPGQEVKPADYTQAVVTATRKPERHPVQVPRPPSEVIEQVEQLEPVPGFRREFVLIGYDAFGITEETTSVLGKKTVKRKLQRIDSLPEGTVFAQGYTPRVVIKDGQVLAIEFLKLLEEEEYQHEKPSVQEEMARQITELIESSKSEKSRQKS
ncbi:MAG: hypothetical protein ACFFD8_10105 [Candidatus Thorarchaeota archaeon]